MSKKLVIIGYGSAGRRFAKLSKKHFKNFEIHILTKQKKIGFPIIKNFRDIKKINPRYIIVSSPTSLHFKQLKKINDNFKNISILVEKPLFHKYRLIKKLNNRIYVGYNMRILKIIKFLKSIIYSNKSKIYEIEFINHSYLPDWRKNINYSRSSSAKKKYGGGVILDCSHELDLVNWLIGKIKLLKVISSKKSNLKIETEDNCLIYGSHKKINVKVDLNYFTKKKKRLINIFGDNLRVNINLISAKSLVVKNKKIVIKKFDKNELNNTYYLELKDFLCKKEKNLIKYNSALKTQKLIQEVQSFLKK